MIIMGGNIAKVQQGRSGDFILLNLICFILISSTGPAIPSGTSKGHCSKKISFKVSIGLDLLQVMIMEKQYISYSKRSNSTSHHHFNLICHVERP
jgi:hypothetical protein